MLELTERTSTVMQVTELDSDSYRDPVVNTFRTFAQIHSLAVSGNISVVPETDYAETITSQAREHSSDLVLIPWFDHRNNILYLDSPAPDAMSSESQESFVRDALERATCNTAVFIDKGFGGPSLPHSKRPHLDRSASGHSLTSFRETTLPPIADRSHHIYFPYFGGVDDRVALRFVLQLAKNSNITATIVHFITPVTSPSPTTTTPTKETNLISETEKSSSTPDHENNNSPLSMLSSSHKNPSQLNILERIDTNTLRQEKEKDTSLLQTIRDSLPQDQLNRVMFTEIEASHPLKECVEKCKEEMGQSPRNAGDLVVVGRRGVAAGRAATGIGIGEEEIEGVERNTEIRKSLGCVAEVVLGYGVRGSLLVVQARVRGVDS